VPSPSGTRGVLGGVSSPDTSVPGSCYAVSAGTRGARFYFTDAGEIHVELALVGGADGFGKILGAVFYAVENAEVLQAAAVFKDAVRGEGGIDLDGDGRVRALPGEVKTHGMERHSRVLE
jgi:hypothetical protein